MKIRIEMKPSDVIIKRLINDKVGIYLAETWAKEFKKYTPADTKMLMNNYTTEPYKVIYHQNMHITNGKVYLVKEILYIIVRMLTHTHKHIGNRQLLEIKKMKC